VRLRGRAQAYSLGGENMHYGTPVNPTCPDRVPGGSSSGSAVRGRPRAPRPRRMDPARCTWRVALVRGRDIQPAPLQMLLWDRAVTRDNSLGAVDAVRSTHFEEAP